MGKRNLTLRVSDEEMEWLKKEADAQMRPVGNLIMWVVRRYMDQKDQVSSGPALGLKTSDKD